jgi:hypothetical protein
MTVKVLLCGPVQGKIDTLFQKLAAVNQKSGPFAAVLCVGEFFEDGDASAPCPQWFTDVVNDDTDVPLPVYFAAGSGTSRFYSTDFIVLPELALHRHCDGVPNCQRRAGRRAGRG